MSSSKSEAERDSTPHDARSPVVTADDMARRKAKQPAPPQEIGGRKTGLDPTRYYDWEKDGRCVDF